MGRRLAPRVVRHTVSVLRPLGPNPCLPPSVACSFRGGWIETRFRRVSVVNKFGQPVYFSYAKPARAVIDYRTRYSGVTAEHLANAPPARKVQDEVSRLAVAGRVVLASHHPGPRPWS